MLIRKLLFSAVAFVGMTATELPPARRTSSSMVISVPFLLAGDSATPDSFSASLGGNALDNLSNIADTLPACTSYSYTATASSTALQFTDADAPGYLFLSNVSVTPTAVPEPASIMAIGIPAAMALLRRRRLQV